MVMKRDSGTEGYGYVRASPLVERVCLRSLKTARSWWSSAVVAQVDDRRHQVDQKRRPCAKWTAL